MNKQLASAVLDTFRAARSPGHELRLQSFPVRAWERTFHWLDASGLALYFLRELKVRHIDSAIPAPILFQLERRHQQNVERAAFLFEEFARLNAAFRAAGLQYVNLKGFTLVPDFCPDPSLRYQTDCDFLMSRSDARKCSEILNLLGYGPVAANEQVLEFKTDEGTTPRIKDLYKVRPGRSVEIHLCDPARPDREPALLERSHYVEIDGDSYPALCCEDAFLSQAWHLFRHVRSEWTRISWLLELRHFVERHRGDTDLWRTLDGHLSQNDEAGAAVGLAVHFAEAVLGSFAPHELTRGSVTSVPSDTALWVERYANKIAVTDFPGSKLYLILERTLSPDVPSSSIRRRLFPTRAPAPVVAAPNKGIVRRLQALFSRTKYFCFRLRFHLLSTSQYLWEFCLWNRQRRYSLRQPYTTNRCSAGTVN